jgi:MFS family permease
MIVFMAINVWSAYCTLFNELLASRIVGGLAAGIVEALGPMIVTETFPEEQLASAMVVYSFALGAGASIGPVVAGLVYNRTHTWPWVFKISAILTGANLLSSIIMLPETIQLKAHAESRPSSVVDAEKSAHFEVEPMPQETPNWRAIWAERSFFFTLPDIKPEGNFIVLFLQPFSLLMSPAVLLTAVTFGIMIAFTVMTSIVFGTVLAMPPLLWTPLKVGLLNISTIIGLAVGMPTGGLLADIFYRRSARRNDGTGVRESRLKALLSGAIIAPLGLVIIGVVLQKNLSWVGLAFGWMMLNIGLTAVANVMLTYSVDCYPWRAAHIGVVMNVVKNVVSFGTSYGVIPWYTLVGPQNQYGTMAGIAVFFFFLNIPLSIYGKRLRTWSLNYIM